jgi:hypothetical protein
VGVTYAKGQKDMSMIAHDDKKGPLQGWHLDKRITVSHLFTTLAFALAIGGVLYAQDIRITNVENDVENHSVVVAMEIANTQSEFQLQMNAVKEMDRQMMLQQNAHFNDIILRLTEQTRRLERIEDGIDSHIQSSQHGVPIR